MDISVEVSADNERMSVVDDTVDVVDSVVGLRGSANTTRLMAEEQHLIVTHTQDVLVPTAEVQIETQTLDAVAMATIASSPLISLPVDPPSPNTDSTALGDKRTHIQADLTVPTSELLQSTDTPLLAGSMSQLDLPRKKSRNYLDSHKTIEKKRRDRINTCLDSLKTLVPDCRQYGSKKLDKAEILEMTIEYIQSLQSQGVVGRGSSNLDMSMSQREWANDLTTWVIHHKLLYSGPNALDQFCQALLLHLQSMGSGNALASATSMLLNQANSNSEDDSMLRQQTVTAQSAILQHLQQQASPVKEGNPAQQQLQQAQLTQLQALLLLQQQQQLLNQQQQQETDSQSQQSHLQQLQQLQQLQALLLQHIANETTTPNSQDTPTQKPADEQGTNAVSMVTTSSTSDSQSSENPSVELARADDLGGSVTTEETVYTSALAESLGENLLQVNVSTRSEQQTNTNAGQMWSSEDPQTDPLVMLGGGGETEGVGVEVAEDPTDKSSLTVQEEVELLVQQEQ